MKKTAQNKIPSAIITADLHLRDTAPKCRTDDYWKAQNGKIKFIRELQQQYQVPILDGGDLLDTWKSSPYLEGWAIDNLPDGIITVPGNHELPYHNVDRLGRSSLNVLGKAKKIQIVQVGDPLFKSNLMFYGFPFGTSSEAINEISEKIMNLKEDKKIEKENYKFVAICHILVYEKENLWPGLETISAMALLRKLKGFDLMVTGHNHLSFTVRYGEQLLVNPGSMMRMTADQVNHKPRVYLWYAETNEVEPIYLPIEQGVISRKHIEQQTQRNERMEAFVNQLDKQYTVDLDFKANIEKYFELHSTQDSVRQLTMDVLEEAK